MFGDETSRKQLRPISYLPAVLFTVFATLVLAGAINDRSWIRFIGALAMYYLAFGFAYLNRHLAYAKVVWNVPRQAFRDPRNRLVVATMMLAVIVIVVLLLIQR
ncbi:MAG: hypothetical protein Q4Q03_02650 [Bowdeniella nasicola]|nr:hypothetical protein [Bowdeniella nasicola]